MKQNLKMKIKGSGITAETIKDELKNFAIKEKADFLPKFFNVKPGGYGDGDIFIGVMVPVQRKTAKQNYDKISLEETEKLLRSAVHEHRLTALFILVNKYEKTKNAGEKKQIADLYLNNIDKINNWDLVDLSAPVIIGGYLKDKPRNLLYDFAVSGHLWKQRIALLSTFHFIKTGDFDDALKIAELLLNHKHDLIHKAAGWMLREVGKRSLDAEIEFLKPRYKQMPRTMLRYAIEKFDEPLRLKFLKGTF